jgi:tetratricopeptide (TPR) repeat protein
MLAALALSLTLSLATQTSDDGAALKDEVEELYAEGAALYRAKQYGPAIEKFEQAFALFPDPNLLYNSGRAYQALDQLETALARYRACVSHPDVLPQVKERAEAKIRAVEELLASRLAARPDTNVVDEPDPEPPPAALPEPVVETVVETRTSPWLVAGGVVAGAGIALAGAGGTLIGLGLWQQSSVESSGVSASELEQQLAVARRDQTVGIVLAATGGGLAVVGVGLAGAGLLLE